MKKLLVVGLLVFGMTVGAFAVYADSGDTTGFGFGRGFGFNRGVNLTEEERDEFIQDREEFFEKQLNLTEEERQEWFEEIQEEREEYREERIKNALKDGIITEEQATEWRTHFNEMEKFREENGFIGAGFCHGSRGSRGYGRGMMNGYGF